MDEKILILGIGNVLLGDEGIGVHTVRALANKTLPENVTILDGGTGGFHLMSYLQDYPKIIMIDATIDGKPPGTISVIKPKYASDFPKSLSAHDIGLKDLIESVALIDKLPDITLITVSIVSLPGMSLELTQEVEATIPHVIDKINRLLGL
jgi:hydrogenase maturation protease